MCAGLVWNHLNTCYFFVLWLLLSGRWYNMRFLLGLMRRVHGMDSGTSLLASCVIWILQNWFSQLVGNFGPTVTIVFMKGLVCSLVYYCFRLDSMLLTIVRASIWTSLNLVTEFWLGPLQPWFGKDEHRYRLQFFYVCALYVSGCEWSYWKSSILRIKDLVFFYFYFIEGAAGDFVCSGTCVSRYNYCN